MKTITFTCETITPMFLSGADGKTPELRAPSIKGAMRFWWRAMNGHLDLADLKKQESLIFGGTDGNSGGRSKFIIRVSKQPIHNEKSDRSFLLPHKEGNKKGELPCFMPNSEFVLNFRLLNPILLNREALFDENKLIELVEILSLLGGLGKGSRRGFGAFRIKTLVVGDERKELSELEYQNSWNQISVIKYPFIKKIEIGSIPTSVDKIRKSTSKIHSKDYQQALKISKKNNDTIEDKKGSVKPNPKYLKYPNALGNGGRFASPIYISVIQKDDGKLYPIITTLNTAPPKNATYDPEIQNELINSLLL